MGTPADMFENESTTKEVLKQYSTRVPMKKMAKQLDLPRMTIEEFMRTRSKFRKKNLKETKRNLLRSYNSV